MVTPIRRDSTTTILSSANHTFNFPAGTVEGDLLINFSSVDDNPTITGPTDWNRIFDINFTGAKGTVFWKIATAADVSTGSATYSTGSTEKSINHCYAIEAGTFDPEIPIDIDHAGFGGFDSSPIAKSITTTKDSTLAIGACFVDGGNSRVDTDINATPSGWTLRENIGSGSSTSSDVVLIIFEKDISTEGATGDATSSLASTDSWVAYQVAINPRFPPQRRGSITTKTSGTSHIFNFPAGLVAGDFLLCLFAGNGEPAITDPSGWTREQLSSEGSGIHSSLVVTKIADSADVTAGNANIATDTAQNAISYCYAFETGTFDVVFPFNIQATANGINDAPTAPSVTSVGLDNRSFAIGWASCDGTNLDSNANATPSGWTLRENDETGVSSTDDVISIVFDKEHVTSNATGNAISSLTASDDWFSYQMLIQRLADPIGSIITTLPAITNALSGSTVPFNPIRRDSTTTIVSGTNHTFNFPAGTVEGDLLFNLSSVDGNPTITGPTDWNKIRDANFTGAKGVVFWKVATAADITAGAATYTTSSSEKSINHCYAIEAGTFDPITPIDIDAVFGDFDSSPIAKSITTTKDLTLIIGACFVDGGNSRVDTDINATPSGWTLRENIGSGSTTTSDVVLIVFEKGNPAAGATGDATSSLAAIDSWVAYQVAINPRFPPQRRGSITTQTGSGAGATNHIFDFPAGLVAGDFMVCLFASNGEPSITDPSGWDRQQLSSEGIGIHSSLVLTKTADATDVTSGNANITTDTSQNAVAYCYAFESGTVDTVVPINNEATANGINDAPTAPSLASLEGTNTNFVIGWVSCDGTNLDSNTNVTPEGWNLRQNFETGISSTDDVVSIVFDKEHVKDIPTGNAISSLTASDDWFSYQMLIQRFGDPIGSINSTLPFITTTLEGASDTPPPITRDTIITKHSGLGVSTHNFNFPVGAVEGDLLLALISIDGVPTVTKPIGWELEFSENGLNSDHKGVIFWKIATAADISAGSTSFDTTVDETSLIYCYAFEGGTFNSTSPFHLVGTFTRDDNNSPIAPSITTTINNTTVIGMIFGNGTFLDSDENATPTGGWTLRINDDSSETFAFSCYLIIFDKPGPFAEATQNADSAAGTAEWIGLQIALAPVGGPERRGSITTSITSDKNHIFDFPAGLVAGDFMICFFNCDSEPNITDPVGWNRRQFLAPDINIHSSTVITKIADSNDVATGNATIITNSPQASLSHCYAVVVDTFDPDIPIVTDQIMDGTSSAPDAPALTTIIDSTLIIGWASCDGISVDSNSNATPAGWTLRQNETTGASAGQDVTSILFDKNLSTAGSSGNAISSLTGSEEWVGYQMAIQLPGPIGPTIQTLPSISENAAGQTDSFIFATIAETLPFITQTAAGALQPLGSIAQELLIISSNVTGLSILDAFGEMAQRLKRLNQNVVAIHNFDTTIAQILPSIIQNATVFIPPAEGSIAQILPKIIESLSATVPKEEFEGLAIYPDDAIYNTADFIPLASPITYTNTGSTTTFPIAAPVDHKGQVLAFKDGLLVSTRAYELLSNNHAISFLSPPTATSLVLRNINVPKVLKKNVTIPAIVVSEFSNTSTTIINSNSYQINGSTTKWAFGETADGIVSKDQILVAIDELVVASDTFKFPSTTLGNFGLDITPPLNRNIASISIRVFEVASTVEPVTDRCRGIIDRKPAKGFSTDIQIDSIPFRSQSGYSKSRLVSRRPRRKWTLQYVNITGIDVDAIEEFYNNRFGQHETFVFDLTHVNKSGTVFVRFAQPLRITFNQSLGTAEADTFYTVDVVFEEMDD